jgi:malonyl-CoA/methylmalonyl-CoA synthetase
MNANLYTLLESHFGEGSGMPCLLVPNGPVIHYDELAALSGRIAHALVRVGCRRGDRVAAQVDKQWQVLALYLACLRAGLVYLPLNTGYQKSELAYFFDDATPRVIVCRPQNLGLIATLSRTAMVLTLDAHGGELLDRAHDAPASFETVVSKPDDVAAIVYTSGTTGRSKGATLTHRNLASNAITLVESWGFTRSDVLLHALPIYHVHGLFVATHCALLSGSRVLWLPKFDAKERYGMTETGMLTSNPLEGARIAGAVGKPLPGVALRVVDGSGGPCWPGTIGHVEVKGPNVFSSYWRMPERTRDEFTSDGYFKTGDMGEWVAGDESRGYLRLVGRAKDLIITGGLNVYPLEIEERIDMLDGVVESAVIGVPDPDFGEAVTAVVVGAPGHELTEREIIGALKAEIAMFKVPKRVFFAEDLPRNAMGKVQKNVLREKYAAPTTI